MAERVALHGWKDLLTSFRRVDDFCILCSVARGFTHVAEYATLDGVIQSFRHKGLRALFLRASSAGVRPDLQKRTLRILNALHQAQSLNDLNFPGFSLHALHTTPKRYAISVNGPWRITFEWIEGDAWRVDLEQYH